MNNRYDVQTMQIVPLDKARILWYNNAGKVGDEHGRG